MSDNMCSAQFLMLLTCILKPLLSISVAKPPSRILIQAPHVSIVLLNPDTNPVFPNYNIAYVRISNKTESGYHKHVVDHATRMCLARYTAWWSMVSMIQESIIRRSPVYRLANKSLFFKLTLPGFPCQASSVFSTQSA